MKIQLFSTCPSLSSTINTLLPAKLSALLPLLLQMPICVHVIMPAIIVILLVLRKEHAPIIIITLAIIYWRNPVIVKMHFININVNVSTILMEHAPSLIQVEILPLIQWLVKSGILAE